MEEAASKAGFPDGNSANVPALEFTLGRIGLNRIPRPESENASGRRRKSARKTGGVDPGAPTTATAEALDNHGGPFPIGNPISF
jgi:hypothetical protein